MSKDFIRGLDPKESMQIGLIYGIFERIKPLMIKILGEDNPITMDSNLKDDLNMDSLDSVELLMYIEREFDLTIDDADPYINDIKTTGDIVFALSKIILKNEHTNHFDRSSH